MQGTPNFSKPVVESITLTLTLDEAKLIQSVLDYPQDYGYGQRSDERSDIAAAINKLLNGEPLEPAYMNEVRDLIRAGRKIMAIKLIRQETQSGLKEAKDFVDALALSENLSPTAPLDTY